MAQADRRSSTRSVRKTPAIAQSADPSTAAIEAPPDQSEFGSTVQDAERLLRKAKHCFVFVRTGSGVADTDLIDVAKPVIARELKRRNPFKAFPCELHLSETMDFILLIGSADAIEKAERASSAFTAEAEDCPVLPLARVYDELARRYMVNDTLIDLTDRMASIADAASHLSPRSAAGAAFQIMLASGETDLLGNATTRVHQERARERVDRLLYRVMDYFASDAGKLAGARSYVMSEVLDPARRPRKAA